MSAQTSVLELTALLEARGSEGSGRGPARAESIPTVALRVRGEYEEMPGLRLTVSQAARLFAVAPDVAHAVLERLRQASELTYSARGTYSLRR